MADKNVLIKHKTDTGVDTIYPQTKSTLVDTSTTNTTVTGSTLSEVLANAIPLKAGTNISISADGTISSNAISSIDVTAPITKKGNTIGHDNVLGGTTNTKITPSAGELKVTVPEITATPHGHISALSGKEVTITLPADVVKRDEDITANNILIGAANNKIKSSSYSITNDVSDASPIKVPTSEAVSNYVKNQITQGANYLGVVNSFDDLPTSNISEGDWARASGEFTYSGVIVHTGDILIVSSISPITWDVLHTEVDTDTWRPIQVDGFSIGNNTLNLKPGANITLSRTNGDVTISSTDTNTTYTLSGEDAKVTLTASDGTKQSITVNKVEQAASVGSSLIIKLNGGTTEGSSQFTFDGSAGKQVNITPSNIGAATSGHTHNITLSGDITSNSTSIPSSGVGTVSTTIANNAVTTAKIKDGAVTAAKLGTSAKAGTYSAVLVTAKGLVSSGAQVYKYYAAGTTDTTIAGDTTLVNGGFAFVEI